MSKKELEDKLIFLSNKMSTMVSLFSEKLLDYHKERGLYYDARSSYRTSGSAEDKSEMEFHKIVSDLLKDSVDKFKISMNELHSEIEEIKLKLGGNNV